MNYCYIFLFLYHISFVSSYNVHLHIICDDICNSFQEEGGSLYQLPPNQDIFTYQDYYFDFSLRKPILAIVSDKGGILGFRGNLGFTYFTIPIKNNVPIWTMTNVNSRKMALIDQFDFYYATGDLTSSSSYYHFTFEMNICQNNTYYITDEDTIFDLSDHLLNYIEKIEPKYNELRIKMKYAKSSLSGKMILNNGNVINSNDYIKISDIFIFHKENINFTQVTIYLDVMTETLDFLFFTCSMTLNICGEGCKKCDIITGICNECHPNYSFNTSEPVDYCVYNQCYFTCDTCSLVGDRRDHQCSLCSKDYPIIYNENNVHNCLSPHNLNLTVDEVIDYIDNNSPYLSSVNQTLYTDELVIQVYPSNSPPNNECNNISSINLEQCELVLKREHNIPIEEPLIIVKYDVKNTNQVEYKVYDQSGNELNLSLCNNLTAIVEYPLNIDSNSYEIGKLFLEEEGIDLFKIDNPFFNKICYPYSINETDLTLSDRRELYQNQSLCEEGCSYIQINYKTNKAQCNCITKESVSISSYSVLKKNSAIFKRVSKSNLIIAKCYKTFYSFNNLKFNIGFWLMLTILFLQVLSIIIIVKYSLRKLYSEIKNKCISSPSSYESSSNYNYFDIDNRDINEVNDTPEYKKNFDSSRHLNSLLTQSIEVNVLQYFDSNQFSKDYYNKDWCSLFIEIMKYKYILFKAFEIKSKYEMKAFNVSFVLFHITIVLIINCLLFTNKVISKKYHNEGYIPFSDTFIRAVISFAISLVLYRIEITVFNYKAYLFDKVIIERKNDALSLENSIIQITQHIKKKIVYFSIVNYIFEFVGFYYLTIFCFIFYYSQFNWIIESGLTLFITFIIYIVVCSIYTLFFTIVIHFIRK